MFPGMAYRRNKNISGFGPSGVKVRIIALLERKYSVSIGVSILASLATFHSIWICKQDNDECETGIVYRKCM